MPTIFAAMTGVAFADFDNDDWKDIFTFNSHVTDNIAQFSPGHYELANSIFRAKGNGQFEDVLKSRLVSIGSDSFWAWGRRSRRPRLHLWPRQETL